MNKLTEKLKKLFPDYIKEENEQLFFSDLKIKTPEQNIDFWDSLIESSIINIIDKGKIVFLIKEINNIINKDQRIEDAKIRINISDLNEAMSCFLLSNLPENLDLHLAAFRIRRLREKKEINIIDVAKSCFVGYYILTIEVLQEELFDKIDFESIAKATLFNLSSLQSYNYKPVKNFEEIFDNIEPKRLRIKRRTVSVPHLKYSSDLVDYYIEGNSARIPKIQYLSFYNVLEYEFDKLFYEEQCKEVQKIIVDPKFNHSNLNNYKKIVKIFDKKNKFSERELLLNLIKEHINVEEFKEFLGENNYYLENPAYKIKNSKFSLEDKDDKIREKIRDRIYGVRNALVHSKESNEEKYLPQEIKKVIPELELIKYLAEQIIIKTAKTTN